MLQPLHPAPRDHAAGSKSCHWRESRARKWVARGKNCLLGCEPPSLSSARVLCCLTQGLQLLLYQTWPYRHLHAFWGSLSCWRSDHVWGSRLTGIVPPAGSPNPSLVPLFLPVISIPKLKSTNTFLPATLPSCGVFPPGAVIPVVCVTKHVCGVCPHENPLERHTTCSEMSSHVYQ